LGKEPHNPCSLVCDLPVLLAAAAAAAGWAELYPLIGALTASRFGDF
jgi:hypothetical protein